MNDVAMAFWRSRCKHALRMGLRGAGLSLALLGMAAQGAEPPADAAEPADLAQAPDTSSPAPAEHPYKLTFGLYPMRGGGQPASTGADLNLRYGYGSGNVWLGRYEADGQGTQWRGGWDRSVPLPGGWRLQPSLQLASGGFAGGSLGLERGERWVAGAGLGRTNLRPYVNLNFDPNDAWMLWAGYHPTESQSLSVLVVRDNRQNPDQQHMHLVYRGPVSDGLALLRGVVQMNPIADDPSPLALHVQALLQRETGQVLSPAGLSELMALTGHGGASAWSDPVQQREVTVVLADLRGFTALTATQPAGVIIALLNRCLAVLSEVILRHGGTIDKFMGDSVMALFGAPQGRPDDVERALVCAVEMQLAMAVLNREGSQQGLPELYMGIGINTGQVIAGRFGSAAYSQYTVIGDEVNLASRIESFSLRGQVLVSEHTYQRCAHLVEASGPMEVHVKGKSEAVRVREVVAIPSRGLHVPRAEVRRSHRVEVRLPCTLHELQHKVVLPHPMAAVIIDVGYHGLQIELDQPLEPFAELKLEFALLLVDFTVSDVYAKVVKCRPCEGRWRAGLEFTAIGVESSARLQTFVQLLVAVR